MITTPPPVALTVYNNEVYIVRGNNLYIFKPVENRFVPGTKIPVLIGRALIEPDYSGYTTINGRMILRPLGTPTTAPQPGEVLQPGMIRR